MRGIQTTKAQILGDFARLPYLFFSALILCFIVLFGPLIAWKFHFSTKIALGILFLVAAGVLRGIRGIQIVELKRSGTEGSIECSLSRSLLGRTKQVWAGAVPLGGSCRALRRVMYPSPGYRDVSIVVEHREVLRLFEQIGSRKAEVKAKEISSFITESGRAGLELQAPDADFGVWLVAGIGMVLVVLSIF